MKNEEECQEKRAEKRAQDSGAFLSHPVDFKKLTRHGTSPQFLNQGDLSKDLLAGLPEL